MARTTNAVARHQKRKRLRRATRGYWGAGRTQVRQSRNIHQRALRYAWHHRFLRKRDFRKLWITRISAAVRAQGLSYSRFMYLLKQAGLQFDRKTLSELAIRDEAAFSAIVSQAREAENQSAPAS